MPFEYVMSGVAHSRVTYESCWGFDQTKSKINDALRLCQGRYGHHHSFLYNAYTEKQIGKMFNDHYKDSLYLIHADSGGLQVVTRGEEITPDLKRLVYSHQGEFSDIAMSFDEIPLTTIGKSAITDLDNRFFDYDIFHSCAEHSAKNIAEQIEFFRENGSQAKPLLIAHGNNVDDFCRWVDICLEYIPDDLHSHIGGLSLAGTALGAGMAEIVERLFSFSMIEAPENMKKNLHLLGVGSIARMTPCSALVLSGLFKDVHISYDSTTHSAGVTRGTRTTYKGNVLQYGRNDNVALMEFRKDIEGYFPGFLDGLDDLIFRDILTSARNKIFPQYNNTDEIKYWYHLVYFLAVMVSVLHATRIINENAVDEVAFRKYCAKKKMTYLIDLLDVQTKEQFLSWQSRAAASVPSQRVQILNQNKTLDGIVDLSHLDDLKPVVNERPAPNSVKPPKANLEGFF